MLCRILMWEGRFCVFVTVASAFSGFRPWVRKYPSIFAHCLKYNFFLAESVYWWLIMHVFGVFWLDLLFLFLGFFFWIKTDERRTKTMLFDVFRWSSTYGLRLVPTDLDKCVVDDIEHGFSRCSRQTSTDSVLDCYASRSVGGTVGVSRSLLFFVEFYVFYLVNCFILIYISMFWSIQIGSYVAYNANWGIEDRRSSVCEDTES